MTKHVSLILVFHLSLTPACISTLKYCYEGTYEIERPDGYLECDLCPEGTYMPEYDHRHTACYNCTKTQSHLEVVGSPCNRRQNTVIHCVEGYYRDLRRSPHEKATCKNCTECQFTGRPCQTYSDTICCMYENSEVVTHKNGYLTCRERPYLCRKGQYMDTSVNECLPCPSNTFMSLDYHILTECLKCPEYDLPLHAEIIQSCNSTHAPVVACKKGFYMNHAMGYKDSSIGCSPCRDCNKASLYEGRACDGLHDTVCCPQPNMTVLDTPGGPFCEKPQLETQTSSPPPVPCCKEDEDQISDSTNSSVTCQPCPTTPNSTNHTLNTCDNCTTESSGEPPSNQTTPKTSSVESSSDDITSLHILYPVIAIMVVSILFNVVLSYLYYRYNMSLQCKVFQDACVNPCTCFTKKDSNHQQRRTVDSAQSDANGSANPFLPLQSDR